MNWLILIVGYAIILGVFLDANAKAYKVKMMILLGSGICY